MPCVAGGVTLGGNFTTLPARMDTRCCSPRPSIAPRHDRMHLRLGQASRHRSRRRRLHAQSHRLQPDPHSQIDCGLTQPPFGNPNNLQPHFNNALYKRRKARQIPGFSADCSKRTRRAARSRRTVQGRRQPCLRSLCSDRDCRTVLCECRLRSNLHGDFPDRVPRGS